MNRMSDTPVLLAGNRRGPGLPRAHFTGFLAWTSGSLSQRRLPQAPRPYRAFGYPVSTFIVLAGSLAFLLAAIVDDWQAGAIAILFLSLSIPAYAFAARSRRARLPEVAPAAG